MTTQFYCNPLAGILRAAYPGKDAISPASPADIMFDAFGPRLQSVFAAGLVAFSSFSGPTSYSGPSGSVSAHYWVYTVNFGVTFSQPPQFVVAAEFADGGWGPNFFPSGITYPSGIANGSAGGFYALGSTSQLKIYWYVVNYPNPTTVTPPSNASYRIFNL